MGYPPPSASTPQYWPPHFYPEDFYTPLSIWWSNIPPPAISIHLRAYKVQDIPLGDIASSGEDTLKEQDVFSGWLRSRWAEKDSLMTRYLSTGSFAAVAESVALPLRLESPVQVLAVFSYFVPVVVISLVYLTARAVLF